MAPVVSEPHGREGRDRAVATALQRGAAALKGVGALIQRGGRAVAGMLTIATAGGS